MDTNDLITLLRTEVEKVGYKCYSPDLPPNETMCSRIYLGTGTNFRTLSDSVIYSSIPIYILIKGTTNDIETRKLADKIFNQLDMKENLKLNSTRIILCSCMTPNYAFRDENQNICYNINCNLLIEWSDV